MVTVSGYYLQRVKQVDTSKLQGYQACQLCGLDSVVGRYSVVAFGGIPPLLTAGVFIKAVNSKCYYFVESVVSVLLIKIAGYSAVKLNLL